MKEIKVVIILGSKSDLETGKAIAKHLGEFDLAHKMHIASAHKTPEHLLEIIKKYDGKNKKMVYICVAGRSNALGGFVDAQTTNPVINCPPKTSEYGGLDILSSLRMPSGVAPMTVLEVSQAALAAAKILGLANQVSIYQKSMRQKIIVNDRELNNT